MSIYLDKRTQLFNGSSITLRDSRCAATLYAPNNEYGLITAFDKCGTTKTETTTHVVYENEVVWNFGSSSSGITRTNGKKISFTCSLQRHRDTSNVNIAPTTNYITSSEGNTHSLHPSAHFPPSNHGQSEDNILGQKLRNQQNKGQEPANQHTFSTLQYSFYQFNDKFMVFIPVLANLLWYPDLWLLVASKLPTAMLVRFS